MAILFIHLVLAEQIRPSKFICPITFRLTSSEVQQKRPPGASLGANGESSRLSSGRLE